MDSKRVLLLFLLGLLGSCGGEPPAVQEETTASETSGDLIGLIPENDAVAGWTREGEPRFFTADNLWEFINGAAEGYLLYGFEEVITSDYGHEPTAQQAVIDIYRMQDPVHAFGIYCQERSPDYDFLDVGGGGYLTGTALNFWQGPYYVKMTVFEEHDELKTELQRLAEHVASKIGTPSSEPAEVFLFPTENQKPHTIQFLPRDALGQSYLSNAFEAQYEAEGQEYKVEGQEYKVVIALMDSPEAATEGLGKYREFLSSSSGREPEGLEGMGDEGFVGEDSFYGAVIAVRADEKIIVVLGPPSVDHGKRALEQVLGNL